jgi:hypothetical protein
MDALDGNAIAGQLLAAFGRELTTATTVCASCGTHGRVGQLLVYRRAPGSVVRCPTCATVVMILLEKRGITCVDLLGLSALEPTPDE